MVSQPPVLGISGLNTGVGTLAVTSHPDELEWEPYSDYLKAQKESFWPSEIKEACQWEVSRPECD